MADEITRLGAAELARRIAAGELSSRQVVDAHIARIEAVNPKINAVVVPLFDRARAEADAADRTAQSGAPLGPLHGVPITIKEQFKVAGTPVTVGLVHRKDRLDDSDGPMVQRLRAAGAVILGKTNVIQLLSGHETDNPLYGRTNNPWDLQRSPGGSSGGEAAVIAAGGSPLGLGGDFGGSVRLPCHCCGIHGLKPTAMRLSGLDTPGELFGHQEAVIYQPGPMAREVADLVLAMEVLAAPGQQAADPLIPPVPWAAPAAVSLAGLRVGVCEDDGFFAPAPAIRRAVREASVLLAARGAEVKPWTPPEPELLLHLFMKLTAADRFRTAKAQAKGEQLDPRIKGLFGLVGIPDPLRPIIARVMGWRGQHRQAALVRLLLDDTTTAYWERLRQRADVTRGFFRAMDEQGVDLLLTPPLALPAYTHGAAGELFEAASYQVLYNLLGLPAGVVAATRVREGEQSDRPASKDVVLRTARQVEQASVGLPVGVQVAGRLWREDQVLAAMLALEQGFRDRPDYPTTPVDPVEAR